MQLTTSSLIFFIGFHLHFRSANHGSDAFNLDPRSRMILTPSQINRTTDRSIYFGFSQTFYGDDKTGIWLIVGAPRGNSSFQPTINEPGVLFRCRIADAMKRSESCQEIELRPPNETVTSKYRPYIFNQWLGVAIDAATTATGQSNFVACGHRYQGETAKYPNKSNPFGVCYSWIGLEDDVIDETGNRLVASFPPLTGDDLVTKMWKQWNSSYGDETVIFNKAHSQRGTSAQLTSDGDIVIGAPGLLQWQGGLVVKMESGKTCYVQNVTDSDSYLGYSVTSIKSIDVKNETRTFASGAPRYKEIGRVYILTIDASVCNINNQKSNVSQEIDGKQFGSYFGSSILSIDVDNDGDDDLFVGSPFYNESKGDEGRVFVYLNDGRNRFNEEGVTVLKGSSQQGARFGTALTSISDINLDGFNDVVIGAPYEDEGAGVIYLYLGSRSGIIQIYSQRIQASKINSNLKTFGHSFSRGTDVDGNEYPDLAIGAFMGDSVVILRSRGVHDVTASFQFPTPVISWKKTNCSKTNDQTFEMTLTISFNYSIPQKEISRIETAYIFTNLRNESAGLTNQFHLTFNKNSMADSSTDGLSLLVVPCLAKQELTESDDIDDGASCVSFMAADKKGWYVHHFNGYLQLKNVDDERTTIDKNEFNKNVSFFVRGGNVSTDSTEGRRYPTLSEVGEGRAGGGGVEGYVRNISIESFSQRSYFIDVDKNGDLISTQKTDNLTDGLITLRSEKYLPCIKDLSYELTVDNSIVLQSDRRAFPIDRDGQRSIDGTVRETVNFTISNLENPLTKTWRILFPSYPKNIQTPLNFSLTISAPTVDDKKLATDPLSEHVIFGDLTPVLNPFSPAKFSSEIGFYKECGDDDVCNADLVLSIETSGETKNQVVIEDRSTTLRLRISIENVGETAYSVRIELRHPTQLQFNKLSIEDDCNHVTASVGMDTNETSRWLTCDVENQLHKGSSVSFLVEFDATEIDEDFPDDFVEFRAKVGTDGIVKNETKDFEFFMPVKYEAKMTSYGTAKESRIDFDVGIDSDENVTIIHMYDIRNSGPGLMPGVIVDVLLPDDVPFNLSYTKKIIRVKKRDEMFFDKMIDGVEIKMTSSPTTTTYLDLDFDFDSNNSSNSSSSVQHFDGTTNSPEDDIVTTTEEPIIITYFLRETGEPMYIQMDCEMKSPSCTRSVRFNVGSVFEGDSIDVEIEVGFSIKDLSQIQQLEMIKYTSHVIVSPAFISHNVSDWKKGNVERKQLKTLASTRLFPKAKPITIPTWVYIVSGAVGLIILVVVIILLKRCGFFERNQRDILENEKRKTCKMEDLDSDQSKALLGIVDFGELGGSGGNGNDVKTDRESMTKSEYSIPGGFLDESVNECSTGGGGSSQTTPVMMNRTVDAYLREHSDIEFRSDSP